MFSIVTNPLPNSGFYPAALQVKPWFWQMPEPLQDALAQHLGQLLTEATVGSGRLAIRKYCDGLSKMYDVCVHEY